jgi:DUF1365 family protein
MNGLKLFEGAVSHHRTAPTPHQFTYNMFQVWLDVKQVNLLDEVSRWWSSKRFNLVQFKRQDYLPSDKSLFDELRLTIKKNTGNDFSGNAFLLANLSYWGYCFNPVVFFACYEGDELRYLVTEVHNTPWNERFVYVHDTREPNQKATQDNYHEANFDKAFHVSPFMSMDLRYRWKYKIDDSSFFIRMILKQKQDTIFNVSLNLKGKPLSRHQANIIPFRFPLMCIKVITAIYWQALRLWLKRVPFIAHPK